MLWINAEGPVWHLKDNIEDIIDIKIVFIQICTTILS